MAICLEATIQRFNGISSDDMPISPPEGSTLHLIDTGEQYIYHNGMWERDLRMITALRFI